MSSTQTSTEKVTAVPTAATVDLKLEVVVVPVSDMDRAKSSGPERTGSGSGPRRRLLPFLRVVQRSGRQQLAAAGNQDAASRARAQQPGRGEPDRVPPRGGGATWRLPGDGAQAPLVRLVRRLYRCARAGADPGRSGQGRRGSHGTDPPVRADPNYELSDHRGKT
jgi:hypothetical protein